MENGVNRGVGATEARPAARARDAEGALLLAELLMVQQIDAGGRAVPSSSHNAFGDPVVVLPTLDPGARVERARERAASGQRVSLVASAAELSRARHAMSRIAHDRLSVVFHAVEPAGVEAAFALADLGWGVLFADGVEESFDLTLIARRASEDSGTPFLVVHERGPVAATEPLAPPGNELIEAFIGAPASRLRRLTEPPEAAHPAHAHIGARGFAERVPFALGSAFRELETLTGRKHDLITRSQAGDAALMLVGLGPLGGVVMGEVDRLRAAGHDVGAVKLTALRPFPGPRLVRHLARAHAVTVLEGRDEPLAQSSPLTREVKAAFADALTWAPEYPGIGRIPRIHCGVVHARVADVEAHDIDAMVRNMHEADHGKRFFGVGGAAHEAEETLAPQPASPAIAGTGFHITGVVRDGALADAGAELLTGSIDAILALRVRATTRKEPGAGGGTAFDIVASSRRPHGVYVPQEVSLVVIDDPAWLIRGNPLARLGKQGVLAVASKRRSEAELWGDMPPYVKAIVFDRNARLIGWDPGESSDVETQRWLTAAGITGVSLASIGSRTGAGSHVDASLVERTVAGTVGVLRGSHDEVSKQAGRVARAAFESQVAVARGLVEADVESVRLGRKDARAAADHA